MSEEKQVGFVTMGAAAGGADIRPIGVGMLGYAFMGKAHSNGYRTLAYMTWPPPLLPRLVAVAGRNEEAVAEAARRYGFEGYVTDWRELVAMDEIELFDNAGPNNLHAEPSIAAAEAGKHVVCEKPLARTADESYEVLQRVAATGVKHMCAFNYRFVPAVRLAREMIEAGDLGEIYHFRGRYLQEWGDIDDDVWRFHLDAAGSGALGDLGAHVIDLARYLVGEIESVSGATRTFKEGRDVDDAFEAVVEFEGGALGTLEASRFCPGRKNAFAWEINGSKGSIAFDLERLNELQVHLLDSSPASALRGSAPCWSPRPTIPSGSTGGPTATSSAGSTPSCTSCTISSARSPRTATSVRTGRRSRTATERPRSATRSFAPAIRARGSRWPIAERAARRAAAGRSPGP